MADKVIEDLKQLKHCLTKPCDITCSYYNAEDMICPCSYDVSSDVVINNAIQVIRELQELNKGLSETNTSNPMYEIGYKKGASDMEQAKQIIIDKLQEQKEHCIAKVIIDEDAMRKIVDEKVSEIKEQIPKWHLVADGDLPKENSEIYVSFKNSAGIHTDIATFYNNEFFYFSETELYGYIEEKYTEVIAWMELPKFSREEDNQRVI